MASSKWKVSQQHWSLEKCKLKPQDPFTPTGMSAIEKTTSTEKNKGMGTLEHCEWDCHTPATLANNSVAPLKAKTYCVTHQFQS